MTLPYDIARCKGMNAPLCRRCLRTEPGNPTRQLMIPPALTIDGCINFIGKPFVEGETLSGGLSDEMDKNQKFEDK